MQLSRSSTKRARSPVVVPGSASTMNSQDGSQLDGGCMSKTSEPIQPSLPEPPKLPEFLNQNEEVLHSKYNELNAREQERLQSKDSDPSPDHQWARFIPDGTLDRYNNVHPWANNRVKLQVPEGYNDYINASPIAMLPAGGKPNPLRATMQDKYICMQGPKKETVDHTWHMVWHSLSENSPEDPGVILMLTPHHGPSPIDPTRMIEKCFYYYPLDADSPLHINDSNKLGEDFKATVRFISMEKMESTFVETRKLAMSVEGEDGEKIIWHFLYPMWPDFGALADENVESILSLMTASREKNAEAKNPRVIHCSAGVGRTGTFVALEFLLCELEGGAWEGWYESLDRGRDPVFETVDQLRMQRRTMVQAFEQYLFLYDVLRRMWEDKYGISRAQGNTDTSSGAGEPPAKVVKY